MGSSPRLATPGPSLGIAGTCFELRFGRTF
jgi:hypothetical protein